MGPGAGAGVAHRHGRPAPALGGHGGGGRRAAAGAAVVGGVHRAGAAVRSVAAGADRPRCGAGRRRAVVPGGTGRADPARQRTGRVANGQRGAGRRTSGSARYSAWHGAHQRSHGASRSADRRGRDARTRALGRWRFLRCLPGRCQSPAVHHRRRDRQGRARRAVHGRFENPGEKRAGARAGRPGARGGDVERGIAARIRRFDGCDDAGGADRLRQWRIGHGQRRARKSGAVAR